MGFYQLVTVRPGDCLWTIAQQYLGNGDRYTEIVDLNLGHDMGHGQAFTDPSMIWPGWVLHLPARRGGQHRLAAPPRGADPAGTRRAAARTAGTRPATTPFSHHHRSRLGRR